MTPDERAYHLVHFMSQTWHPYSKDHGEDRVHHDALRKLIADAIREAVAVERARLAAVVRAARCDFNETSDCKSALATVASFIEAGGTIAEAGHAPVA
jgi:hypothetical protein